MRNINITWGLIPAKLANSAEKSGRISVSKGAELLRIVASRISSAREEKNTSPAAKNLVDQREMF